VRAAVIVLGLAFGCGIGERPPERDCAGAAPRSLAADVRPLFRARCAGAECHGQNYAGERAFADLVGASAAQCADGRVLVEPFAPSQSYLWQKLTGQSLCAGSPMPKRAAPLTTDELAIVRGWICAGARDD
jgi:hypothetical protein